MKIAVFLDRDGVINRKAPEGQYVTRWDEMVFLPRVAEAAAALVKAGFCIIVVSNQRCVSKGLLTMSELKSLHENICQKLAAEGALITDGYYCPHDTQPPCNCRKPAPGMLLAAARDHDIDLARSWMIGDSETDVQAGMNAGCRTARILSNGETAYGGADLFADSLFDAAQQILLATHSLEPVPPR
jgi:D-glycero-D-manno-heptose 1,7-bisphosphate phosphatase